MKLLELGVLLEVDRISAPSELECEEIRKLTMDKSAYVSPPYFYEAEDLHPRSADHFASLSDVVFVGGFPHSPECRRCGFHRTRNNAAGVARDRLGIPLGIGRLCAAEGSAVSCWPADCCHWLCAGH